MSINAITKIKLADGTEVALKEWSSRPRWSAADLWSGMTDKQIRLFSYTRGETVSASSNAPAAGLRVATRIDTNVTTGGQMDDGEEFIVEAIGFELWQQSWDGADLQADAGGLSPRANILKQLHVQLVAALEISRKEFAEGPFGFFPPGFDVMPYFNGGGTPPVYRSYATNSEASRQAIEPLSLPVRIGGTENYAVLLKNPFGALTFLDEAGQAPANDIVVTARCILYGLHKRGAK